MNKSIFIKAEKSPYLKCERCWNYWKDCDYNKYFEDILCKRCVDVLCKLEEKGKWLKCPACLEWFCDDNCTSDDINDNYLCQDCMKEMKKVECKS
jgi:hypothetical protein